MKIDGCEYPESLLYDTENGTWAKDEGDAFRVGTGPQLNWLSGGYTSVTFKEVGSEVLAGNGLGSVEGPRHFDLVRAPFNCRIRSVNERLRAEPKLINRDPYGQGWFATIENLGGPTSLRPLPDVVDALRAKLKDLAVKCFAEFPDQEMYEIGVECSVVLVKLSDLVRRSPSGTVIHLVTDDPTSDIEMERWRAETGNSILDSRREANLYHFVVKKR